jgi:hypothetical protein
MQSPQLPDDALAEVCSFLSGDPVSFLKCAHHNVLFYTVAIKIKSFGSAPVSKPTFPPF